jgi:hypothetical protein
MNGIEHSNEGGKQRGERRRADNDDKQWEQLIDNAKS